MAELIRQDESQQVLNAIAQRMQQLSTDEQRNGYIDLLSMAATPAAQQILIDRVLNNEQADSTLKARVLTQLADVKQPSAQLVATVDTISQHGEAELRNLALLTIGGLAHSLQTTDSQAANNISSALTSRLQVAATDEERELLLLAVGNAGLAATESAITGYLASNNPHLRGAAILALRKLPATTVEHQLIDRLTQESSAYVQEMAAIALSHRLETAALHTAEAEEALQAYAASVTAAAVNGVWTKNWNKSFSAGPVTINLPGDITIKGAPDAPAITLDANQSATGSVMGINFSLFRAKLLSDAPSGSRRFGAYFWIGSNTLVWKYEENIGCSFAKSGVLWEGSREFFRFSKSIPVYGILVVTLNAGAGGYAKITYDYQQQLCDANAATVTGKITPQTAITAEGSAYLTLAAIRGGVTLAADILKTAIPAQISAKLTPNGSAAPKLYVCVDVKANVEPLRGYLSGKAQVWFFGWRTVLSKNLWEFNVNPQSYTLLAECPPIEPTPVCSPEYPNLPVILGTEGNDPTLNGTAQSERICGLNGHDGINGNLGNDVINGNQGNDVINGDAGDDLLRGEKENDTVNGGDGNDSVYGDLGDDTVQGNIGNDTVAGGDGNDIIHGGQNDDTVMGDAGNDIIYGGLGNDNYWGGAGADFFEYYNGHGNDTIHDFQWSVDRLRLYDVAISSYRPLGADCQINLSTGATIRLVNVGACRNPQ